MDFADFSRIDLHIQNKYFNFVAINITLKNNEL